MKSRLQNRQNQTLINLDLFTQEQVLVHQEGVLRKNRIIYLCRKLCCRGNSDGCVAFVFCFSHWSVHGRVSFCLLEREKKNLKFNAQRSWKKKNGPRAEFKSQKALQQWRWSWPQVHRHIHRSDSGDKVQSPRHHHDLSHHILGNSTTGMWSIAGPSVSGSKVNLGLYFFPDIFSCHINRPLFTSFFLLVSVGRGETVGHRLCWTETR